MAEVAQILRFTDRHVRKLIEEGEIEAHHFGKAVRISRANLDKYIEQGPRSPQDEVTESKRALMSLNPTRWSVLSEYILT